MANIYVTGRIVALRRMRNSINGNPRFKIEFVCESDAPKYSPGYLPRFIPTAPDASFAYNLDSSEWRGGGLHGVPSPVVILTINGRGNAVNIEHVREIRA